MPHDKDPTEKQREVLRRIMASYTELGYSPSQNTLARDMGLKSPTAAAPYVDALERKGYLSRGPGGKLRVLRDTEGRAVKLAFVPSESDESSTIT